MLNLPKTAPHIEPFPKGWADSILGPQKALADFAKELATEQRRFAAAFKNDAFTRGLEQLRQTLSEIAKGEIRDRRIEAAGWLPHYTTPTAVLASAADDEVADILHAHYETNWPAVHESFLVKLDSYQIDDEAKACFHEALQCHRNGHFRAVVRVLFPEIERVVRKEVLGGRLKGVTSLKEFRDIVSGLPVAEITSRCPSAMTLYFRLAEHLYAKADDHAILQRFEKDAVPNRHAALHGLVAYRTRQNSVNTLIMADFALLLVSIIVAVRDRD